LPALPPDVSYRILDTGLHFRPTNLKKVIQRRSCDIRWLWKPIRGSRMSPSPPLPGIPVEPGMQGYMGSEGKAPRAERPYLVITRSEEG
jgi:hypothetical protein